MPSDTSRRVGQSPRPLLLLLAVLTVAPAIAVGGVHWQTQLCVLVLSAAAAWLLARYRRGARQRPLVIPPLLGAAMALATAMTVLQLAPLPAGVLPAAALRLRTLVSETPAVGWAPLSLSPHATAFALVEQLACILVLIVAANFLHRSDRLLLVARVFFLVGALLAIGGLIQDFTRSGLILGVYRPSGEIPNTFMAPFVNRNHGAAFFLLVSGVGFGVVAATQSVRARVVTLLLLLPPVAAVLVTRSRGALMGLAAAAVLTIGLRLRGRTSWAQRLAPVAGIAIVLGLGFLYAHHAVESRISESMERGVRNDPKTLLWQDALALSGDFRWFGVGRRAFQDVFPSYKQAPATVSYTHVENIALQAAVDWGWPVAIALVLLVAAALMKLARAPKIDGFRLGILSGVVGLLVQNLSDFNLEFPGTAVPACVFLGSLVAAARHERTSHRTVRRFTATKMLYAAAVTAVVVAVIGVREAGHSLHSEDAALQALVAHRPIATDAPARAEAAVADHPADYHIHLLTAAIFLARGDAHGMRHLNLAMILNPRDASPHEAAARVLAATGHRSQAALEYRAAFERGQVPSEALARELIRACGDSAVDAVPMQPTWIAVVQAADFDRIGQPKAATVLFRRMLAASTPPDPQRITALRALLSHDLPDRIELARQLAMEALSPGDVTFALEVLRQLGRRDVGDPIAIAQAKRFPREWSVLSEAVDAMMRKKALSDAEHLLENAVDHIADPNQHIMALEQLATVQELEGRPVEARNSRHAAAMLRAVKHGRL